MSLDRMRLAPPPAFDRAQIWARERRGCGRAEGDPVGWSDRRGLDEGRTIAAARRGHNRERSERIASYLHAPSMKRARELGVTDS